MEKESLEEVKKKYKLSDEEHEKIGKEIQKIMLYDAYPVENPIAIIDIAPPASGKTGLNGFGKEQFVDNNVVIINSDELKPFHPYIDEIAKHYPQYYTKVTDQESNTWTSDLFDRALAEGYNVIFEGTGKNARILDTIKQKMKNYKVIVRGMSVNSLNCLISIIERFEYQIERKGWGRLVTMEHFYETYHGMPETIDTIEKSKIVDSVEVYKRGKTPFTPIKIYDSKQKGRYQNAKIAVLEGRKEDEKVVLENCEERISEIIKMTKGRKISEEEKSMLTYIVNEYKRLKENYNKKDNEDILK